jgi:hypothetical protein
MGGAAASSGSAPELASESITTTLAIGRGQCRF